MSHRLAGLTAIVTGGARGMGESHVRAMVKAGAKVVIADILPDPGQALAAELGDSAAFFELNVVSEKQWQECVAFAEDKFGSVDILVNNAGIGCWAHIAETSLEQFEKVVDVDLIGTFLGIKTVVPAMRRAKKGSIVNIASIIGTQGYPEMSAYAAAKWGVRGLTKSAAIDLAPENIRVNIVNPGQIVTPFVEHAELWPVDHVAMNRMGKAAEVTAMVLFLVSDESSFCTGADFTVDGGETLGLTAHPIHKHQAAVQALKERSK